MELIKWRNTNTPAFKNLMDEFFKNEPFAGFGGRSMACAAPAVNVRETSNGFDIEVAAPGFGKDAFKVEVDAENVLVISGENKKEEEMTEGRYSRREFMCTNFKRRFTLPENVNAEKIEATYADGVLWITLPKREEAPRKEARTINVK